jgi:hypothetical protein
LEVDLAGEPTLHVQDWKVLTLTLHHDPFAFRERPLLLARLCMCESHPRNRHIRATVTTADGQIKFSASEKSLALRNIKFSASAHQI